jgi:predicted HicB family RNase H-like nuclease
MHGRTAQFDFKSTPGLHQRAKEAAARNGVRLAKWMESLVEAALAAEEKGRDA